MLPCTIEDKPNEVSESYKQEHRAKTVKLDNSKQSVTEMREVARCSEKECAAKAWVLVWA